MLTHLYSISLQRISEEVGIKAMPTFVAFKKGEKTGSIVGADPTKLKVSQLGGSGTLLSYPKLTL